MAAIRHLTIDTVRGVAVLGILAMNIIGFGFPGDAYVNPLISGGDAPANLLPWAVVAIAIDGKMRALFAMLFGASMLLMAESGPAETQAQRHRARMAVLFLFGMLHGSLLWHGDILLPFAIAGLLVFPLRRLAVKRLLLLGFLVLGLQAAVNVSAGFAMREFAPTEAAVDAGQPTEEQQAEIAAYRGSPSEILAMRHEALIGMRLFAFPLEFFLETIGLMLIGMALFRLAWWQGGYPLAHYVRVARAAIPLGLALGVALALVYWRSGFAMPTFLMLEAARNLIGPGLALGYAAGIIAIVKMGAMPRAVGRLAATGRMALTNYLMASVLCNLLFTGFGLGLFASLSRIEVLLVMLGIWALQLAWSKPWLAHFQFGPAEWLWRSLSCWQRQPFRKVG